MKSNITLHWVIFLCSFPFSVTGYANQCQLPPSPKAVYATGTRLHEPEYGMSVIYDGEDSILIFNGRPDNRAIYSFNIITEELNWLAHLPVKGVYAPLVRIQDGSYLYFGNSFPQRVYRFDPVTNSGTIMAEFPLDIGPLTSFFLSNDPNKVYLTSVRNECLRIDEFDTTSFCIKHLKNITAEGAPLQAATFGDYAFIFSRGPFPDRSVTTKIQRDRRDAVAQRKSNVIFPKDSGATTVTTTKYVYLLGGFDHESHTSRDGILQFHRAENKFKFIRIDDTPLKWKQQFGNASSMAFVGKLNRIYFFGGKTSDSGTAFDHIWHIDVNPMEEYGGGWHVPKILTLGEPEVGVTSLLLDSNRI